MESYDRTNSEHEYALPPIQKRCSPLTSAYRYTLLMKVRGIKRRAKDTYLLHSQHESGAYEGCFTGQSESVSATDAPSCLQPFS